MTKLYTTLLLLFITAAANAQQPFVTTWQVAAGFPQVQFQFTAAAGNMIVFNMGDGTEYPSSSLGNYTLTHTYAAPGTYTITMTGQIEAAEFHTPQLVSVDQWGDSHWATTQNMFANCENVVINATDVPDLSGVTSMNSMFEAAASMNQSINNWDVSNVTSMQTMFLSATAFNQPLGNWDVSNVTNMLGMFANAQAFNQDINSWDVSNVASMDMMFSEATAFNQPLNDWDVSNVGTMEYMFAYTDMFNQPITDWDVSNVTTMSGMFSGSESFNQPLSNWDIGSVTNLTSMFIESQAFDQDLSAWDFSGMPSMYSMLSASAFSSLNYDKLLLRFAQMGLQNGEFMNSEITYCNADTRAYLIEVLGWEISGDEPDPACIVNTISGTVLFDADGNGCDNADNAPYGMLVKANNGLVNVTGSANAEGEYNLNVFDGTYTTSLLNLPTYFTAESDTAPLTLDSATPTQQRNFCLIANQSVSDLNITLLPVTEARPGFDAQYEIIVENRGSTTIPNTVLTLTYDGARQTFVSALPVPATNASGTITFTMGTLLPFAHSVINVTLNIMPPPTVNGEELLNLTASLQPVIDDVTPEDTIYVLDQPTINAYDPNDKQVLQGDLLLYEDKNEYLDYIIRFQNTGSASAINVRVDDNLHANLDWSTLRPVSASHDYRVEVTNGNHVSFIFPGINLPHEAANAAGSHGFIAYKIKPVQTIAVGDVMTGNAAIYFDYNLPIITNSVSTQVYALLGTDQIAGDSSVTVYPNPTSGIVNIEAAIGTTIEKVTVSNLQGRALLSFNANQLIDLESLSAGIYLVTVKTDSASVVKKVVKY